MLPFFCPNTPSDCDSWITARQSSAPKRKEISEFTHNDIFWWGKYHQTNYSLHHRKPAGRSATHHLSALLPFIPIDPKPEMPVHNAFYITLWVTNKKCLNCLKCLKIRDTIYFRSQQILISWPRWSLRSIKSVGLTLKSSVQHLITIRIANLYPSAYI